MEFSMKHFFSKFDHIRRFLQIWSHILKKSLMENFIFCVVIARKKTRKCKDIFLLINTLFTKMYSALTQLLLLTSQQDNIYL